jgi:hypothetical protein
MSAATASRPRATQARQIGAAIALPRPAKGLMSVTIGGRSQAKAWSHVMQNNGVAPRRARRARFESTASKARDGVLSFVGRTGGKQSQQRPASHE